MKVVFSPIMAIKFRRSVVFPFSCKHLRARLQVRARQGLLDLLCPHPRYNTFDTTGIPKCSIWRARPTCENTVSVQKDKLDVRVRISMTIH